MQAAGDAPAFLLLRLQRAGSCLTALGLEPLHHLVERALERADLTGAPSRDARAGSKHVGVVHPVGKPFERLEEGPQCKPVDDHHHREPGDEVDDLGQRCVLADRREGGHEDPGGEDRRIGEEDAPEERRAL